MARCKSVLISGMGIAGPTLAYWLKEGGFTPTLVERTPELRTGGYVVDFWGLGFEIAERMGLASGIETVGYHVREMRIEGDNGERLSGFDPRVIQEVTNGHYVTLGRSALSRLLYERIKDTSEVIFGEEIVALQDRGENVLVRFEHRREREFDLVIGADGLHSRVRQLAFGPQHQFEKRLGYTVAAFEAEGYVPRNEDAYVMYGQPGKTLGRFTLRDNKTLFLFVFAAANDELPHTLDRQREILRLQYGEAGWECPRILKELDRTRELYFDRVSQIMVPSWSHGRIALVGDAAFCISLMGGQGTALAMTAAYVLAGELTRSAGRHEEALARYEALLRGYIETKQRAAERFAAAFVPETRLGLWFRNQVVRAFAIPGLGRLVIGREIADTVRLPDYRWPIAQDP